MRELRGFPDDESRKRGIKHIKIDLWAMRSTEILACTEQDTDAGKLNCKRFTGKVIQELQLFRKYLNINNIVRK
jgi:hypothetical protein